jgi:sarcosine oxidase subunit alpha
MTGRDVTFYFEGRRLEGRRGEPIAKALFRVGVRTLSYSVKYKRPRGINCVRGRCVMCHMSVNGIPGVPTCITPLEAGMRIERERYDPFFAPLLTAAVRLFPFKAGFYYRLFNRPRWLRRFFLQNIRKMAGVGRVRVDRTPVEAPRQGTGAVPLPDNYDVIVVGAGISGMSAAAAAVSTRSRDSGEDPAPRVLLVDEYGIPGGHSIGFQTSTAIAVTRDRLIDTVLANNNIRYQPNTTALGFYPPDTLLVGPGGSTGFEPYSTHTNTLTQQAFRGMKQVRARAFVFATGAYDVTPLFTNNDTPGIFGPRAIRLLLERDGLTPGQNAIVYGTGETMDQTAELLANHGIKVAHRIDPTEVAGSSDSSTRLNGRIIEAKGKEWITGVTVRAGGNKTIKTIECDMLCVAFPGQSAYELPYQAGFKYSLLEGALGENQVLLPDKSNLDIGDGAVRIVLTGEAAGVSNPGQKTTHGDNAGKLAAVLE